MRLEDLADDDCCLWCGAALDMSRPRSIQRKHCDEVCYRADYHDMEKQARLDAKRAIARICEECDGPILPEKKIHARFCSSVCGQRASNRRAYARRRAAIACHAVGGAL